MSQLPWAKRHLGTTHLSKALPEVLKNLALRLADGLAEAGSTAFQSDSCLRPNFGFTSSILYNLYNSIH